MLLSELIATTLAASEPQSAPAKKQASAVAQVVNELAARLEPTRKIVYKTVGDRELRLHIFEPAGHQKTDRRPCFLGIHGGGWTGGEARRFYPYGDHMARHGLLGVSLEYRLMSKAAGTTPFESVKDGRSAVRYLRAHAADLGIDPAKIVVSGGSAGGHVAAGTALFDGVDEVTDDLSVSSVPNALVLLYPVIDTSPNGYGNAKCGPEWQRISPLHHVKPGLPPTVVFHGTGDTVTPFAGAKAFHVAMLMAGNSCELKVKEGGRHGYFLYAHEDFSAALQAIDDFLVAHKFMNPPKAP